MKRFLLILASLLFVPHGYAQYGPGVSSATLSSATNVNLTRAKSHTDASTNVTVTAANTGIVAATNANLAVAFAKIVASTNANLTVALAKIVASTNANLTVAKAHTDAATNKAVVYMGAAAPFTRDTFTDNVYKRPYYTNELFDTGNIFNEVKNGAYGTNGAWSIPKDGVLTVVMNNYWICEANATFYWQAYTNGALYNENNTTSQDGEGDTADIGRIVNCHFSMPVEEDMSVHIMLKNDENTGSGTMPLIEYQAGAGGDSQMHWTYQSTE